MAPLTTAFVSPGWPAGSVPNGIVTYTAAITGAMRDLGARPFVISVLGGSTEDFVRELPQAGTGESIQRLLQKLLKPLSVDSAWHRIFIGRLLTAIRKLQHEQGVRLIEMEETYGWAGLLARKSPIPVVVRLHGPWFINGPAAGAKPDEAFQRRDRLEGMGIARAAGVTAGCRSVLERTREHFGLPLANAVAIPYPVAPIPAAERWTAAGCDPGRVLFVGRFDRHKGADIILDAFSRVHRQMPSARLDLVGPDHGVDRGGGCVQFRELAAEFFDASVAESAVELHGFQPLSRLPPFRRRAQITVVCSRDEIFPLAALDALAYGCPLVVSSVGGLTEMVEHGRNGLVFKSEDAQDLADKMLSLLRDPELCTRLGRQGAEDATNLYRPDVAARKTLDFYDDVLSQWARRRGRLVTCVPG